MTFIEFKNIQKAFHSKIVYTDLNLQIEKGQTVSILGGSGSGKSVMLKMLLGLIKPDQGQIYFDGIQVNTQDRWELINMRRRFGMLFQGGALFDSMSVFENVAYPIREHFRDWSEDEIRNKVKEKLNVVGLSGIEHQLPASLSGGMVKRVALARALATDPEVILYDEPTAGLDPSNTKRINQLIVDLKKRFQVTSLVVTHHMESAYKISDRLALLHDHKIGFVGSPAEIDQSQNEIVRRFIDGNIGETS